VAGVLDEVWEFAKDHDLDVAEAFRLAHYASVACIEQWKVNSLMHWLGRNGWLNQQRTTELKVAQ
jgi:hypothetical protein